MPRFYNIAEFGNSEVLESLAFGVVEMEDLTPSERKVALKTLLVNMKSIKLKRKNYGLTYRLVFLNFAGEIPYFFLK